MAKTTFSEVSRGGGAKVGEAGGVIAGGHPVVDAEPKSGLCVTGRVHPDRILIKGGLRPGDRVFLSKPLGTGVITTDRKSTRLNSSHGYISYAVFCLTKKNKYILDTCHLVRADTDGDC